MRRSSLIVLLIAILLSCATASGANQLESDEHISMSLRGAELTTVLAAMGKISGMSVDLGPGISGAVDIDLEDVSWRKALDQVCTTHGLRCVQSSGENPILRVRAIPSADLYRDASGIPGFADPISISLKRADAAIFVQYFEIITGWQVDLDPEVTGQVTAQMANAPWPVALEEACRLSGCRVEWAPQKLSIRPGPRETFDVALADVDLAEALGRITPRILDGTSPVEVVVPEGFEPRVTLALRDVTYAEAIDAICQQAACGWQLRYGDPLILTIEEADERLQRTVSLSGGPLTVREVAAVLSRSSGIEIDLGPLVDPDQTVTMPLEDATLKEALATLSRQLGGSWHKIGERIVVDVGRMALKDRPDAERIEPDEVVVRLQTPDAPERATWARFTWVRPTATLATAEEGVRAQLYWVPFAAGRRVLVGALVGCHAEPSVEWLDPVPLPLSKPRTLRSADRLVEIAPGPEKVPQLAPREAAEVCHAGAHSLLEAVIRRSGDGREVRSKVETYLVVAPPSGPAADTPAAAVLVAAVDDDGGYRAALVTPGESTFEIEPVTVRPGEPIERTLSGVDGESWELRLQVVSQ